MVGRALVALLLATAIAHADEDATSPARPGYQGSDHAIWWAKRAAAEDDGLVVDGTYAIEGFFAPQLANRATLGGIFAAELDLELGKLVHERLGAVHVSAFAIHGDSPTTELMDVHGVSGNTAPRDMRLFEAWAEQSMGALTVRAGLIAADQEFVYADPADTLMSATFGITSQFSANILGPVYPIAAPGVSSRVETDRLLLQLAIYDGTQSNTHGIPTALGPDHLVIGEATLDRDIGAGFWRHSELGTGYYITLDHDIAGAAGFARFGYSADGPVPLYVDAGLRVGPGLVRGEDIISIGMAFARTEQGDQTTLEATYEAQIQWLTIQPDLQLVMLHARTVGVLGLRTTVVF